LQAAYFLRVSAVSRLLSNTDNRVYHVHLVIMTLRIWAVCKIHIPKLGIFLFLSFILCYGTIIILKILFYKISGTVSVRFWCSVFTIVLRPSQHYHESHIINAIRARPRE